MNPRRINPRANRTAARRPRRRHAALVASLALPLALVVATVGPSSALTSPAHAPADRASTPASRQAAASAAANPLVGRKMGVYKGLADQSWQPYLNSAGTHRKLLAKIALRPKAKWFGAWISNATIKEKVADYIANSTGGDADVLVQMSVFRMVPWEHEACKRLPTRAEQTSYKQWVDRFAAGVGDAHVALILQPDGPFALCAPGGSKLPSQLIRYSAKKFSALPHTSVYIDGGAADWPKDRPAESARFLLPAGIEYARGFALNSTHYSPTGREIEFGARLVAELDRRGVPGKHFVINTSSNGRGFDFGTARGSHPDNADVCRTRTERHCVTLGIPPTTDVTNRRWGLSPANRARARDHVDAYLWFGRPWLHMQADPFDLKRALGLARTTPY